MASAREIAQGMARQAFDAGLQAAPLPRAERDRRRQVAVDYVATVIAAHLEAGAAPAASDLISPIVPIEEQIAAVEDAEDFRTTSLGWRRSRRGFNHSREHANERGMAGAIATLKALRGGGA